MTPQTEEQLFLEIRDLIIDAVGLHHLNPADFKVDTSLMQGGLALDSVDILEIVVVLEQHYGFKVSSPDMGAKYFRNLGTIVELVKLQKAAI